MTVVHSIPSLPPPPPLPSPSQNAGSKDDFAQRVKQDTQKELKIIETEVEKHKKEVIDRLMEMVYDIKPELHQNARLKK